MLTDTPTPNNSDHPSGHPGCLVGVASDGRGVAIYGNAVQTHLRPRWGKRELDEITGDDAARLVRDVRAAGRAEWTISGVLKAASQSASTRRPDSGGKRRGG